jgi:hypothetical protein
MQEFCLIGTPRTGTNHIVAILANCKKFKSRGEIFHPRFCEGLSAKEVELVGHIAHRQFASDLDPSLVSFVRSNPAILLNVLRDADDGQSVNSFKLFPGHLPLVSIENEIVAREHIHFVFVLRRPIDSFISDVKAVLIGKYFGIDTTALRVKLDPDAFEKRMRSWRNWYRKTSDMVVQRGRQYSTLLYETDIDCAIEQCFANIRRAAMRCGIYRSVFDPAPARITGLERQDTSDNYHDKVLNWDEFMQELDKRKLRKLAFSHFLASTVSQSSSI